MSYAMTDVSPRSFNHDPNPATEEEYDKYRQHARDEISKRQKLSAQSQEAYQNGDGARAKQLSEQAKQHGAEADRWNQKASDFILRENNAEGRNIPSDTIDLHGQYVKEAEEILRTRLQQAQRTNQTHLHVIVGRGNHSAGGIQKIKPAVEQICDELGLAHKVEQNEGRIYIDLTGSGNIPDQIPQPGYGHHGGQGGYPGGQNQPQYQQPASGGYTQPHQQPQQGQQGQQGDTGCLGIIISLLKAIFGGGKK